MKQKWIHYRHIKSVCPACGKPAHLGKSMKTRDYYWLHDSVSEYYRSHLDHHDLCYVEPELATALRENCDPVEVAKAAATGKRRCVRCVESGEVFRSIKEAADHAGVAAASVSVALKKGSRSGGCHWEYLY